MKSIWCVLCSSGRYLPAVRQNVREERNMQLVLAVCVTTRLCVVMAATDELCCAIRVTCLVQLYSARSDFFCSSLFFLRLHLTPEFPKRIRPWNPDGLLKRQTTEKRNFWLGSQYASR
jgi:hypothetical protein